jgi:hypothetical protein
MQTLAHRIIEDVTIGLDPRSGKVLPQANRPKNRHHKNLQEPVRTLSIDYLEVVQQFLENKKGVGFWGWLENVVYSILRKPTTAD